MAYYSALALQKNEYTKKHPVLLADFFFFFHGILKQQAQLWIYATKNLLDMPTEDSIAFWEVPMYPIGSINYLSKQLARAAAK